MRSAFVIWLLILLVKLCGAYEFDRFSPNIENPYDSLRHARSLGMGGMGVPRMPYASLRQRREPQEYDPNLFTRNTRAGKDKEKGKDDKQAQIDNFVDYMAKSVEDLQAQRGQWVANRALLELESLMAGPEVSLNRRKREAKEPEQPATPRPASKSLAKAATSRPVRSGIGQMASENSSASRRVARQEPQDVSKGPQASATGPPRPKRDDPEPSYASLLAQAPSKRSVPQVQATIHISKPENPDDRPISHILSEYKKPPNTIVLK